jgi:ElaB/YqjD/DUF883 family membrane-anchored ribosome-binding protein
MTENLLTLDLNQMLFPARLYFNSHHIQQKEFQMLSTANKNEACECLEQECCNIANDVGRKLRAVVDTGTHDIKEQAEKVEKEIRQHPVQSSAIALGLGVILGLFLHRR